jgi:hypothetical protein
MIEWEMMDTEWYGHSWPHSSWTFPLLLILKKKTISKVLVHLQIINFIKQNSICKILQIQSVVILFFAFQDQTYILWGRLERNFLLQCVYISEVREHILFYVWCHSHSNFLSLMRFILSFRLFQFNFCFHCHIPASEFFGPFNRILYLRFSRIGIVLVPEKGSGK